jgi:hypothetical protein
MATSPSSTLHLLLWLRAYASTRRKNSWPVEDGKPEQDPEKWEPVFGKDHAQTKKLGFEVAIQGE